MELAIVTGTPSARFLPFLDPAEESALLAAAPVKSFARDQLVFDQNVSLRAIFLIDDGSVRVERHDRGAMVPLAVLGAGEFFGEMSFVDGTPTSARVVAEEPTRLRVIDTTTVDNLTKADPGFCRPPLSLDCGHPCRAAAAGLHAHLRRPVLGMMRRHHPVSINHSRTSGTP